MSVNELVQCARALVGGEPRHDFGFIVRNGTIVESGDFRAIRDAANDLPSRSFPADRLVVPGFINGHSHAYQILLRGWADDWTVCPLAQRRALSRRAAAHARRRLLDVRRGVFRNAGGRHHDRRRILLPQRRRQRARRSRDPGGGRHRHSAGLRPHVDGLPRRRPRSFGNRSTWRQSAR